LLNEATDVWRPTIGEVVASSTVRLLPTPDYDADDEQWEFIPGALVECADHTFDGGETGCIAIREVSPSSDT
jgi:hypothetical protein